MKKLLIVVLSVLLSVPSTIIYASSCNDCDDVCTLDCSQTCTENDCCTISCQGHFAPRSQGSDTARRLVGRNLFLYKYEECGYYGTFSIIPEISRSFRTAEIGRYLSPVCDCNCFTVGQNAVANIRGEDFGLNCTGDTNEVCFSPQITNFLLDFGLYIGLDECWKGLFIDIHMPVCHTWWDTNCCGPDIECETSTTCSGSFESCLMSTTGNDDVGTTDVVKALNGNFVWGDVTNEMCFGKLCCRRTVTRIADLEVALGYNFWACEDYHVGIKAVVKAPTGNKTEGRFLFDPIAGNGGRWELGGGLTAHYVLWDRDENCSLAFNFDGYATHMFSTSCETRVFDLCANGCFSRYLLLKRYAIKDGNRILAGLERGPNVFAQEIKTKVNVQGDLTALLSYKSDCWLFDVGYNFWGRSAETCSEFCPEIAENTYGIKGTVPVCDNSTQNLRTASLSTISTSEGTAGDDDGTEPVFLKGDDLNVNSALAPSAISHSFVFNGTYLWENSDYTPFLGLGGKIEFSGSCDTTVDQWKLWLKGGINF